MNPLVCPSCGSGEWEDIEPAEDEAVVCNGCGDEFPSIDLVSTEDFERLKAESEAAA